jgi:hypothetical protein
MNALLIFLLQPPENVLAVPAIKPANLELDFIQFFTKIPNLTHSWNEYKLRTEVVNKFL